MPDTSKPPDDAHQHALTALLRLIASSDPQGAHRLLASSPFLARMAVDVGATREDPGTFYFEEIIHYAYAGDTALHIAAASYQEGTAIELLSEGADVRARNRRGAEPLHYAADGHPASPSWNPRAQRATVELLIRAGADPNAEDTSGITPLHRAVRTRCSEAVDALLSNGADALRQNRSGSTPLHLAVQTTGRGGSGSTMAHEEQARIIRLLLRHGARPSDTDPAGKSVEDCVRAGWILDLLKQTR